MGYVSVSSLSLSFSFPQHGSLWLHPCRCRWPCFSPFHGRVVFHYTYVPSLLHSFTVSGYLGCSHIWAVVNNAAMSTGVRESFWITAVWIYAREWECWVVRQLWVSEEPPYCSPQWLYQRTSQQQCRSVHIGRKWKRQTPSHVWLCVTPRAGTHQAPLCLEFSRQEQWRRLPCPWSQLDSKDSEGKSLLKR